MVAWLSRAAEQGHSVAEYNLGVCYGNGEGVSQDHVKAVKWFEKAADHGNEAAREALSQARRFLSPHREYDLHRAGDKDDAEEIRRIQTVAEPHPFTRRLQRKRAWWRFW